MKTIRKWTKDDVPSKRYPRYKLIVTETEQGFEDIAVFLFFHTRSFAEREVRVRMKRFRTTFKDAVLIDTRAEDE